ncbi:TPA: ABC transporter permease [Clostridioides difficile]|nr:ABC transporter permease [Clostridioides difficile]
MLKLIQCEYWKLKRKKFFQLVMAASFLFPIPLTAIIYYMNTAQGKYETKEAAFDGLWQSVMGFGMQLLLPCILGIIAALLFFAERDNDTYKNLRTIPVTSTQMVIAKCVVLLVLSVLFCVSSTVTSMLCGCVFFGVSGVVYKLLFSVLMGFLIALSALPLVLLIVFFSKSYIFSILLCIFYSVFNLMSTFTITALPKFLVSILPTPSIMIWGAAQMVSHMAIGDAEDLQRFVDLGLVPSTIQLFLTLGIIGLISILLAIYLYKKRSE